MQDTLYPIDIAEFAAEVNAETKNNPLFSRAEVAKKLLQKRKEQAMRAWTIALQESNRLKALEKHVEKFGI